MTAEPWRVAQLVVERDPGQESSRGSGYLVAPGRVLTAAHVVAGASAIRVRLDLGKDTEIDVRAEAWWTDPAGHRGTDLAVITVPRAATAGRTFERARFGRISDCTAVLKAEAFGFPLFKLRDDPGGTGRGTVFRDLEQAMGHCPVAANRRQGTLAVYLDDPPPSQPPRGEPSPWEGMSGGPVLAGSRIVGVVAEHHPSEGTGRLTARRIDHAYQTLSAPDLSALAELLGLAPVVHGLPDVVPSGPDQLVRSAYLAQVRDIAPELLIGRDDELADWAAFCAGTDAYTWWQAGPWAGKSALASWFVLHPPAGVDVVSFFITGRLIGQADSDAFLNAMIEQLGSLFPSSEKAPSVAGARAGAWWDLLASAAADAKERGRRLAVVVDGLDEDEAGATPPRGRPSIASLLPRRSPAGVRFIVTSRPDPGLPDDLHPDHPLRRCRPRRLSVSWVAKDMELLAKQELRDLLAGDQVTVDMVGYVAGSGGGLNRSDLSALTGEPPHRLDPVLRGVFGRSLYTRAYSDPRGLQADPATRVYLFAHETLRVTAEEQLGSRELARYRGKVHDWIASYAASGWPDTTPGYAIRGYPRLLAATADVIRLSALARDPRRHAFLLDVTGGDYAALSEIGTAQSLLSGQQVPDLKALVELAAYRLAIVLRNNYIPDDLPVVWALLGRFDRAEAVARAIADPYQQAGALARLITVVAEAGDPDRARRLAADAEAVARTIAQPHQQVSALASLASVVAEAGDPDRARRLAADAEVIARTAPDWQAWGLTSLVTAVAEAGDLDRAEAIARTTADPYQQAGALSALIPAVARAGDLDRARRLADDAEAIARSIDVFQQASALASLATAVIEAGDLDRAETLTRTIAVPDQQALVLAHLAFAAAQAGDLDRAETIVRAVGDPSRNASALAGLASAAARAGDPDQARRLAADAETIARALEDPYEQADVLARLVSAVAEAGDPDRARWLAADAETIARTIARPDRQSEVLASLVGAVAVAGDLDWAESVARTIASPDRQGEALASLVSAVAETGDLDRAEAIARTIADLGWQAWVLTDLASGQAWAGDLDRARRLAVDAQAIARANIDPGGQAEVFTSLASAATEAGDLDRAEAIARAIADPVRQTDVLARLVSAVAEAGDLDRAEAIARAIADPGWQARELARLAGAVAEAGNRDGARRLAADAETIARSIADLDQQAVALVGLAYAAAGAGELERTEAIARTIADPDRQGEALARLVSAVAEAGDLERAEAIACSIADPGRRSEGLAGLASAVAEAGDLDHAEAIARTIADPDQQALVLARLVSAVAEAGDLDRAEAIARTIADPYQQAFVLARLVSAVARAGDLDRARRLAGDAEDIARAVADPGRQAVALVSLAPAVAGAGDLNRAEAIARTITDPYQQAWALGDLVTTVAEAGDRDRAEAIARSIADPGRQAWAITGLASAVAGAGDPDRAEAIARTITDPYQQAWALANLASAAAEAGDLDRAARLLAVVLVTDMPAVSLLETVARIFPAALGDACDILTGVFATPTSPSPLWTVGCWWG